MTELEFAQLRLDRVRSGFDVWNTTGRPTWRVWSGSELVAEGATPCDAVNKALSGQAFWNAEFERAKEAP